jgi:hypothetical protein
MGRKKRSTLPKKTARGKPKGQAPPRAISDKPSGGAGSVKRKRDGGSNPQMKSTKPDRKSAADQVRTSALRCHVSAPRDLFAAPIA